MKSQVGNMPQVSTIERRHSHRIPAQLFGSISFCSDNREGETIAVAIRDISLGGAYFRCGHELTLGQQLDLSISDIGEFMSHELGLTQTEGVPIRYRIMATVVRLDIEGNGKRVSGAAVCFDGPLRILGATAAESRAI